jgi:hypothetical protein
MARDLGGPPPSAPRAALCLAEDPPDGLVHGLLHPSLWLTRPLQSRLAVLPITVINISSNTT